MRLINTKTLEFQAFFDEQLPPYAVVSHRWGAREITLQDYLAGRDRDSPGYEKIIRCCQIANSWGREWVWLDTCCIDKTSSAELTEAINSMYKWYQRAEECYAVLPDLIHSENKDELIAALPKSAWFTRGWTLQELLAPRQVHFYDASFKLFASKAELADDLAKITGIRGKFLKSSEKVSQACVAEKLSWMSNRTTTRIEDTAYCMMGLFGVNMPLLYGEGTKAFFRLQLEILQHCDDESIYAWTSKDNRKITGMLASWPSDFANSGAIRKFPIQPEHRIPWSWTSKGLEVRLVQADVMSQSKDDPMPMGSPEKFVTLGCWKTEDPVDDDDLATERRIANKVVAVKLERKGTAWQRTNGDYMQLTSRFDVVTRSSFTKLLVRHYYIPQESPENQVLW